MKGASQQGRPFGDVFRYTGDTFGSLALQRLPIQTQYLWGDCIVCVVVQSSLTDDPGKEPGFVAQNVPQRLGKGDFVSGRDENACLRGHDVFRPATRGGDQRLSAGHSLHEHDPEAFPQTGKHQQVTGIHPQGDLFVWSRSCESDGIGDVQLAGQESGPLFVVAIAEEDELYGLAAA